MKWKDQIKQVSDIHEVVSEYVELKKSGKNWVGFCPFHEDRKTPNLTVFPETQNFKCFACGKQGDVFKFIQLKENLAFPEALEFLAKRAGIPAPKRRPRTKAEKILDEDIPFMEVMGTLKAENEKILRRGEKEEWNQEMHGAIIREQLPKIRRLDSLHREIVKEWLKKNWKISFSTFNRIVAVKPSKKEFNPRPYSEKILEKYHLKYDEFRRFWIYNPAFKIWQEEANLRLNEKLRKRILGSDDYKRYCVSEILADLQGLSWVDEPPEEARATLIFFKNKIYDLENGKFLEYSPDFFFMNKMAVALNENHKVCPTIQRIFEGLVSPEDIISLYEMIAYTFYRGYPYPKIFVLYGSGGNGKTAYIKILKRVLGKSNISLVSSNDLQWGQFATAQLFGKLANVSGEMEYSMMKNTSKLKLCSGEDLISCERKFKDPFNFMNYAKMIFLTNQVPLTLDKTFAFYRRIFLLEFPNRFVLGENADPGIVDKIPGEEFEGLAWQCLKILKELRKRQFIFSRHEVTEKVTEKYEELSNPLKKFLEERTTRDVNADIPVAEFKEEFIAYLQEKGFRIWSSREINARMREIGYQQKVLHVNENSYKAWLELRWE